MPNVSATATSLVIEYTNTDLHDIRPDLDNTQISNVLSTAAKRFDINTGINLDVLYTIMEELYPSISLPSPQDTDTSQDFEFVAARPTRRIDIESGNRVDYIRWVHIPANIPRGLSEEVRRYSEQVSAAQYANAFRGINNTENSQ